MTDSTRPRSTAAEVRAAIDGERDYQDRRWPVGDGGSERTVGHFMTLLRYYSLIADQSYAVRSGDEAALYTIREIAAIAIQALEVHQRFTAVMTSTARELAYGRAFGSGAGFTGQRGVGDDLSLLSALIHESKPYCGETEMIRRLAEIADVAIRAMEYHGAIPRGQ